jgi:hypothetical protein
MPQEKTYKRLFLLFMGLLLLPMILQITHIPPIRKLEGYTQPIEKVNPSFKNLMDGSYQQYLDEAAMANFGGRGFYIRCYNQFMYSVFHKITNNNIIVGKNGEMFLKQYTDDVSGVTLREKFGTADSAKRVARQNVIRTLALIDSLKAHDIAFLVVLAPSKTAIYPEWLPDSIHPDNFVLQHEYASLFKEYNIPHIDFIPLFNSLKTKEKYPLYTKYGTHWCFSTIPFVADTLLRAMEGVLKSPLPHIILTDSNITRKYAPWDNELESTCNLMFPLPHPKMPWPKYALCNIPRNYQKPNLLVIADSYFTQLEKGPFAEVFGNVDYWKYNEISYSKIPNRNNKIAYINKYEAITDADMVMVMFTTMFAYDYMFGFVEDALETFAKGEEYNGEQYAEEQINFIIQRIKSDPEWLRNVEEQAKKANISLEENLRLNAEYVYEMEYKKK